MSEKEKIISGMRGENKRALAASLGAVVLTGIVLALVITKPRMAKKTTDSYFGKQINNFCINDICLQKDGDGWLTTRENSLTPADAELVNSYVAKLENIEFGDVISNNANNFANLGIGESPVIITANGKGLEIGKINSNYDGTYVRKENGGSVYNTEILLEKNNLINPDQWANKSITNLAALQTNKITVEQNGKIREYEAKNGVWDDPKWVQKADSLTALNYLNSFSPGTETKTTIKIETETKKITITLGEKTQNKDAPIFWVTSDEKYYYSISADDYRLLTDKIK